MEPEGVKRKLTTILAADVEGYSRLMSADEEATLQTLKHYREIIDGLFVTPSDVSQRPLALTVEHLTRFAVTLSLQHSVERLMRYPHPYLSKSETRTTTKHSMMTSRRTVTWCALALTASVGLGDCSIELTAGLKRTERSRVMTGSTASLGQSLQGETNIPNSIRSSPAQL